MSSFSLVTTLMRELFTMLEDRLRGHSTESERACQMCYIYLGFSWWMRLSRMLGKSTASSIYWETSVVLPKLLCSCLASSSSLFQSIPSLCRLWRDCFWLGLTIKKCLHQLMALNNPTNIWLRCQMELQRLQKSKRNIITPSGCLIRIRYFFIWLIRLVAYSPATAGPRNPNFRGCMSMVLIRSRVS